jgi:DivIVA domain-containing protein
MARKRKRREEEAGFGESLEGFGDDASPAAPQRTRLTPVDIQQKVFRLAFRGYNERDVDEFLDHVTEDLAALHEENKRLREQLTEGGGAGTGGGPAARQQAEAIVRQAREHAARLIGEAERRTAEMGHEAGGPPAPSSYLVREREFLQTLASLVQEHARTLKEQARRARSTGEGAASSAPAASAVAAPAEQPEPGPDEGSEEGSAAIAGTSPGQEGSAFEPSSEDWAPGPPPEAEPATEDPEGSRGSGPSGPVASIEPRPEPRPEPPPEPDRGSPARVETASASTAEGPSEAASERSGGQDPLLSAWETAFMGDEGETAATPADAGDARRRDHADEPSLRELFWGEE